MEELDIQGGCSCRSIRYKLTKEPMFVHCCHCRWCQRETGASFALNAIIEANQVIILQGNPTMIEIPSFSGKGQKIWRCPDCCVAIWSNYAGAGDSINFVRVGTLDIPDAFPPNVHIYTESKQPWINLPSDIPSFNQFYELNQIWPDESIERRRVHYKSLGNIK